MNHEHVFKQYFLCIDICACSCFWTMCSKLFISRTETRKRKDWKVKEVSVLISHWMVSAEIFKHLSLLCILCNLIFTFCYRSPLLMQMVRILVYKLMTEAHITSLHWSSNNSDGYFHMQRCINSNPIGHQVHAGMCIPVNYILFLHEYLEKANKMLFITSMT